MKLSRFKRWMLRTIIEQLFIQGPQHHNNAARLFAHIREIWEDEFREDNSYTTDAMLREAFEASQFAPTLDNDDVARLRKVLKDERQKSN